MAKKKTGKSTRMKLALQLISILMRLIPEVRQIALGKISKVSKTVKKITRKGKKRMTQKQKLNLRKAIRANKTMSPTARRKALASPKLRV